MYPILQLLIVVYNNDSITVAIDELDSGIFEYLLGEILRIISEKGNGQLIFTSHNLRPLETIDKGFIAFTTTNVNNRYIRFSNVKNNNNLRDFYYRDIILGEQDEPVYETTNNYEIALAFREAGDISGSGKKIVFVIVEGPSDDEVIGTMLSRMLDKNEVYVQIIHGDITTQHGVTNSNILAKIGTIVQNYAKNNHFKKSDFKEVIHIVDMDGAYIDDEHILEDKDAAKPIYSLVNIKSDDKNKIISRNIQKSSILDKLSCCKTVWSTIPYSCYYMSCNLDHVFTIS